MTDVLPPGWTDAALEELVHINPPGSSMAVPDEQQVSFVPMAAVEALSGRIDTSGTRTFGEVKKGFTRFLDGDVLFAKITPCMENGKIAVARGLQGGVGCGSTEFHVLRSRGAVLPDYLRYFLVQSSYRQEAERNMQGAVGQRRVPTEYMRQSRMPTAPLGEQQRIVSRIEELFSEIDEGERALERVGRLVERYRQSVLKAAVTGELTREWRERSAPPSASVVMSQFDAARAKSGRCSAPVPAAEVDGLPELPSGWTWTSLDAVADVVGGITVDRKRSAQGCDEVPYLRVANVQRGYLDLTEVKAIVAPRERIEQLRLQPGDVLFNEGGDIDKLGRGWLWQGELPLCIHQNHVFRARLYSPGPWNKLISWFGNVLGKRLFMDMGKQTTNLASLSLSKLKSVPVPIMSLEEAAETVSRVEDALSVIDKCIEDLRAQQRGSTGLRQAVLKSAFSGQLVPQDPRDEPATALLARLAAQASDAPATPRRRGRPAGRRSSQPNPSVAP